MRLGHELSPKISNVACRCGRRTEAFQTFPVLLHRSGTIIQKFTVGDGVSVPSSTDVVSRTVPVSAHKPAQAGPSHAPGGRAALIDKTGAAETMTARLAIGRRHP